MTLPLPDRLAGALARLCASVDHLEGAASLRDAADRAGADADLRGLRVDHARLAAELDGALARGRALIEANAEVSARLDRATATVRAVLEQFEPAEDDGDEPDAVAGPDAGPARRAGGARGE